MIGISTLTVNIAGALVIEELPASRLRELSTRVSRVATLDGSAVITHSGFSHADRTWSIKAAISEAQEAQLREIHETETLLYFASAEGFFSGVIERLTTDNGELIMSVLIQEKIA